MGLIAADKGPTLNPSVKNPGEFVSFDNFPPSGICKLNGHFAEKLSENVWLSLLIVQFKYWQLQIEGTVGS